MPCSVGVIGLGRMAQAILLPLLERGDIQPAEVIGVVGHRESVQRAKNQLPSEVQVFAANDPRSSQVWAASLHLLAIKPQQLLSLEQNLTKNNCLGIANKNTLIVSLLAGVNLKRLQEVFPHHACVRAVPNAPVLVGAGLTGIAWANNVTNDQRLQVQKLFSPISEVLELEESQLDAFLALTSSGPAYIALITEALADGAVAAGLPRSLAHYLAHRTVYGTSLLLKGKDMHPGQLKDMVASPGGTTITGLRHLEKAGLRSALIEAVIAASERSRELG